jgi:branched-chain amino acid transport system ATP-binding protein
MTGGSEAAADGDRTLLEVRGLAVAYGAVLAVDDLSLRVERGSAVTILGANGAGKTSALRAIGGLLRTRRGEIWYDGQRIDGLGAESLARRGLVSVTDTRDLFPRFTVEENLRMGLYTAPAREYGRRRMEVLGLFPALERLARRPAWTLSGGEQQMLALSRALLLRPRLLLLDEPSLGLAPRLVESIFVALAEVARAGTALLLVEQVSASALALASHAYVMRSGRVVLAGPSSRVGADPRVVEAYLGGGDTFVGEGENAVP